MWHAPKDNPKSNGKPSPRSGHTLAAANEKAYLFGGCGIEDGGAAVFNDMWILHIADNFRWEKVDAMGEVPSPRWRHSFTFLPDNTSIFLFGGLCRVRDRASRITEIDPLAPTSRLPRPVSDFCCAVRFLYDSCSPCVFPVFPEHLFLITGQAFQRFVPVRCHPSRMEACGHCGHASAPAFAPYRLLGRIRRGG